MRVRAVLLGLALGAAASAHAGCADSVAQLRGLFGAPTLPMEWEEIGMSDGRPLLVNIDERAGSLFISFVQTGKGLLAQGPARVCPARAGLEARFERDGLQLGAAASWLLRKALAAGVAVRLERTGPAQLRIGTIGYSGDFVPATRVGLQPNQ